MPCGFGPVFMLLAQVAKLQQQSGQPTPQQIQEWASKLGDESAQVRDEATKRLIEAGEAAVEEVRKRAASPDPEVKARVERVLHTIQIRRHDVTMRQLKQGERKMLFLDKEKKVSMEFVSIAPGEFMMGLAGEVFAKPHKVTLTKGYYIQTTLVTQQQWQAVTGRNPSERKQDGNLPVEHVSWYDSEEFLKKLNQVCSSELSELSADLPTEAEWEYACRAGSTGRWCFGDDEGKLYEYAWCVNNSYAKTHPVAQKKPNAWGLYDMHGNVKQWCRDWFEEYRGDSVDPEGPELGQNRILRGAAYDDGTARTWSAYRSWVMPWIRNGYIGLRVLLR